MLVVGGLTSVAAASTTCQDNYNDGRTALLNGSLSGLRDAYSKFNEAMQDSTCASDSNLVFLHALTRAAMLVIDNNSDANSIINIANTFGVTVIGDSFAELNINVPTSGGCYTIPPGALNATEISQEIQNSIIPEINSIIAELSTIKDSPKKRFLISFPTSETGLGKTIKVDYSEVLILKGLLLAMKSQLEFKQAYDFNVNSDDPNIQSAISQLFCGEEPSVNFNINGDFLERYVHLLNVLPAGGPVLAQSKKDLINAINYYFAVIKYLQSVVGLQKDHLIYIDPNSQFAMNLVGNRLTTLRNSLTAGAAGKYPLETTNTYKVRQGSKTVGNLVLVYDVTGLMGNGGTLTLNINGIPTPWEIDDFEGIGTDFGIDMEYSSQSEQIWGWFQGTLSSDGKKITNGTLEYWGDNSNTVYGLSAQLAKTQTTYGRLNLNPVFGGSKKYPVPVNPRDLFPQFDANNHALAGTFGDGLGDDATLGGILPDMSQQLWTSLLNLPAASTTVPNVVGLTSADDANTAITSDDLKVGDITTEYSNKVAAGKVISQSPPAGAQVASGAKVSYVISLGKPIVPNVVGLTVADANIAITSAGLKVGTVTKAYNNTVAAGVVISQKPSYGTVVAVGSKVSYVRSLGKR